MSKPLTPLQLRIQQRHEKALFRRKERADHLGLPYKIEDNKITMLETDEVKSARRARIAQMILDNFIPEPNSGCWLWLGSEHLGYGVCSDGRLNRLSLECLGDGLPDGLQALHKCDVRLCCNPAHLYAGTPADNVRDAIERNPRAKTHRAKFLNRDFT